MMKRIPSLVLVCTLPLACVVPLSAHAQATRTWVSGVGDDANPCSRTAPCKTFAGAISKTAPSGEIDALDPAGFGAVTITKPITIAAEGAGEGGVLVSGTDGIAVVCPTTACTVVLRGLEIDGIGTGLDGVAFLSGGKLILQNTVIRNFNAAATNGYGVSFTPNAAASLYIDNCDIENNGVPSAGTGNGVLVQPSSGTTTNVFINNTRISNNDAGIRIDGTSGSGLIDTVITDSKIEGNAKGGIASVSSAGHSIVHTLITGTTIAGNLTGLNANGPGVLVRLASSTVTANATAFAISNGGTMTSNGDNIVYDNPTGPSPALTAAGPQ